MKERPILFSGAMVRALLRDENPKTQTRRVVKGIALDWLQPDMFTPEYVASPSSLLSPYGFAGDRLYVRETFFAYGRWETRFSEKKGRDEWHFVDMTLDTGREYRFDGGLPNAKRDSVTPTWWKRPAIHMPRAASRTLLDVTGARVERLQDISDADALAEGIEARADGFSVDGGKHFHATSARESYASLWDSLNAERGYGWNANPWVWVVEFKLLGRK